MFSKETLFEKTLENVCKMMKDRGFCQVFEERIPNFQEDVYFQKTFFREKEQAEVFFIGDFKTDKSFMDSIEPLCSKFQTRHLIFVIDSEKKIDTFPKNFFIKKIVAEFFQSSFFFHGLENPFGQTYSIAPDEDVRELVEKYGHVSKFPVISRGDRVSRWFNLSPGDVVLITRPSISMPYIMTEKGKVELFVPEYARVV